MALKHCNGLGQLAQLHAETKLVGLIAKRSAFRSCGSGIGAETPGKLAVRYKLCHKADCRDAAPLLRAATRLASPKGLLCG